MLTTHNIDPGCSLHPSARGIAIFVPAAGAAALVAATAESAQVVGTPLTLVTSGTAGIGPAGHIAGTPCSIAFTPSAALTSTYRIVGVDQFDKQVTEDVVVLAAVVHSLRAYKQIFSITPIVTGVSANTISVGFSLVAGFKIALPFRPVNALQGGTTLASFQARIEFVGIVTPATNVFLQTAAGAINERFATVQLAVTIVAGLHWLITRYVPKGFREK